MEQAEQQFIGNQVRVQHFFRLGGFQQDHGALPRILIGITDAFIAAFFRQALNQQGGSPHPTIRASS